MTITNELYLEIESYFDGKIPWPVIELINDHKKYRWFNAKTHKPQMATSILTLSSGENASKAQVAFYSRNNRGEPGWFDMNSWKPLDKKPVFWMPIPQPPPEFLDTSEKTIPQS